MNAPPFRLAGTALHGMGGAACCAPPDDPGAPGARRARLGELDPSLHCSVIGTCLGTAELRKLVPRHVPAVDRLTASDLDLHHEAVQLAHDAGAGAKALHKALDDRHSTTLQRFAKLKTDDALGQAWSRALASGDVPSAYWAVMTHAHTTSALRKQAFGDVHMLSHLVGAANRADIRRLQALERDNADLTERLDRQQTRLQQLTEERQSLADRVAAQDLALKHQTPAMPDTAPPLAALSAELAARDQALAHHTSRRESAESQLQAERAERGALQARLDQALSLVGALQLEVQAVESSLAAQLTGVASATPAERAPWGDPAAHTELPSASPAVLTPQASRPADVLRNRRVVYVGGRPGSNQAIRAMVQAAGGELLLHDGGIEDRKGLLAAALPRADLVVFPVDCVDHDSMGTVKRVCERHGVPFHPVRSASAASFSALLAQLAAPPADAASVSRFCLRHG